MPQLSLSAVALWASTIIAFIAFRLYPSSQSAQTCPTAEPEGHPGYFEYECAGKPHHASWGSWWHPERLWGHTQGQGAGARTKDWNILYHLGGNGPWVEKVIDVVDGGIAVPENCVVEQVHMMSRHAERYPTKKAGTSGFKPPVELLGSTSAQWM
jgi:acid phosphatase